MDLELINSNLSKMAWMVRNLALHKAIQGDSTEQKAIKNILPGDFIVETTTFIYTKNPKVYRNLAGRLIVRRHEFLNPLDNHASKAWHIETLDGRHVIWSNCEFIKVPDNINFSSEKKEENYQWAKDAMIRHDIQLPKTNKSVENMSLDELIQLMSDADPVFWVCPDHREGVSWTTIQHEDKDYNEMFATCEICGKQSKNFKRYKPIPQIILER